MRRFFHDNGLTIAAFGLFAICLVALAPVAWHANNEELATHGQAQMTFWTYMASGHWWEAVFENWESEFLQMGLYVWLTAYLFQRGAEDSNDPDEPEERHRREAIAYAEARRPGPVAWLEDADHADDQAEKAREAVRSGGGGGGAAVPWPVRKGGWIAKVYANSLTLALLALFAVSFLGHAASGAAEYSAEQITHGEAPLGMWGYMATSRFWFESLQNWQSEFLAVGAVTVLSIFLRQKYSSQSKPVAAPHMKTGTD